MSYPSLATSRLNRMLLVPEIFLRIRHFQLSSKPFLHRIGVVTMFAFDLLCCFVTCANVTTCILILVSPYESDSIFLRPSPALILFTTYGTASIEQLFLCYLYFNLWVPLMDLFIVQYRPYYRTKRRIISGFVNFASYIVPRASCSRAPAFPQLRA